MRLKHFLKIAFGATVGYLALFFIANIFFQYIFAIHTSDLKVLAEPESSSILPMFLLSFTLTFSSIIYLFNSWLEGKWVHIKWADIILFMGIAAAMGPTLEIIVNTIAKILLGEPFWLYQLLPVHGGNTSIVMSVIWPIYGFHIYCFHTALKARHDKNEDIDLALFIGMDAITIEVLANLFSLSFFYTYIFYYFASDLRHLSTAVIFIPYVIGGYLAMKVLHVLEKSRHRVMLGVAGFVWNWIVIFVL